MKPVRVFAVATSALLTLILLALASGCSAKGGPASSSGATTGDSASGRTAAATAVAGAGGVTAQVAASELIVGSNRFVLGLLDTGGTPIPDATAHFTFYDLSSPQPVVKGETDAAFRAPSREAGLQEQIKVTKPDGSTKVQLNAPSDVGVYEATVSFDHAGKWGVQSAGKLKNGREYSARTSFDVTASGVTPAIGSPAPPSHNLTVKDVTDLSQIDTSVYASTDMHTESIADGIAAGHPLLVLFATPGYCTSRFCGPELELARKLEPAYKGKVDFIHVEIYKDPAQRIQVDAVNEYHLPSEPWFFVIDSQGMVRAKFEGPTSIAELDAALRQLAS